MSATVLNSQSTMKYKIQKENTQRVSGVIDKKFGRLKSLNSISGKWTRFSS